MNLYEFKAEKLSLRDVTSAFIFKWCSKTRYLAVTSQ